MHKIQLTLGRVNCTFRNITVLVYSFLLLLVSYTAISQNKTTYNIAKAKIVETLKKRNIDPAYDKSIDNFYFATCDSLIRENLLVDNRPIKEILTSLFVVCNEKIEIKSISTLQIPAVNYNFMLILKTYKREPLINACMSMHATQSKILQSVFTGLLIGDSINTYAGLQEMLHDPYIISSRIWLPEYAVYKDTLLYSLANGAPEILANKLFKQDPFYTAIIDKMDNKTVKCVSAIAHDKYFDMTIPFSMALFEKRITLPEIRELSLVPKEFYHAFVMEAIRLHRSNDISISSFLNRPFTELNKKFANYYFITQINDLHEFPNATRFKVLNELPATDLYFLLLGGSSALYTSSFLYLYKKFLEEVSREGLNQFLDEIGYYQFDRFMANISDYGLVDDLMHKLDEEKVAAMLLMYLNRLANKQLTDMEIVLNSMTMAELLHKIRHHNTIAGVLSKRLDKIELQLQVQNHFMYQRIYKGFNDILLNRGEWLSNKKYDTLKVKLLQRNNCIVQVCFFYDDEDAASSFDNCIRSFPISIWKKEDKGNYIIFSSLRGYKIKVFINKPNSLPGFDSAQKEMLQAIESEGYQVTSFIHRGHSYYLKYSLAKMTASAQFVFLGSCGGYNQVLQVFQLNPDVNIIATRGVSSRLINDPILERINSDILNNGDIVWDNIWEDFTATFKSDYSKDLFSSYIQPNNYMGVKFIRMVFNF